MATVLLVNRHFAADQVPTGRMMRDLSAELHAMNHRVRVLTSRGGYDGASAATRPPAVAVDVRHVWTSRRCPRVVNWCLFWVQALVAVPLMAWDKCILLTDPPFLLVLAWLVRIVSGRRREVYLWTMDLYPDAFVADGLVGSAGAVHRAMQRLTEAALRAVSGVVCLGRTQQARMMRYTGRLNGESFYLIAPPWDNRRLPRVSRCANVFLRRHGWADKSVVLYAGNLGEAHSFREVVEAASHAKATGADDWHFVFVVRGARRATLEEASRSLGNVTVLDYQPPELTHHLLWAADVHLITMSAGWEGVVVPSKLYGILHTDIPVLFIGPHDADTAAEIERFSAGAVLPPGASGETVLRSLQELRGRKRRRVPAANRDSARRIAGFVTGVKGPAVRAIPGAADAIGIGRRAAAPLLGAAPGP
ncbi:MAG: hypothetical protein AMK73_01500 [Planctomycetes bacterium SM23_32]|nr:MAG: hypothetical protein AMK73_01500 [Planctomycetes bacterium SM23_32]